LSTSTMSPTATLCWRPPLRTMAYTRISLSRSGTAPPQSSRPGKNTDGLSRSRSVAGRKRFTGMWRVSRHADGQDYGSRLEGSNRAPRVYDSGSKRWGRTATPCRRAKPTTPSTAAVSVAASLSSRLAHLHLSRHRVPVFFFVEQRTPWSRMRSRASGRTRPPACRDQPFPDGEAADDPADTDPPAGPVARPDHLEPGGDHRPCARESKGRLPGVRPQGRATRTAHVPPLCTAHARQTS
jgi:hypothetical protein